MNEGTAPPANDPFTPQPLQALILAAAPIATLAEVVIGGIKAGRVFGGQAIYQRGKSLVTADGTDGKVHLVALVVPIEQAHHLLRAFSLALETEQGKELTAKLGEGLGIAAKVVNLREMAPGGRA